MTAETPATPEETPQVFIDTESAADVTYLSVEQPDGSMLTFTVSADGTVINTEKS